LIFSQRVIASPAELILSPKPWLMHRANAVRHLASKPGLDAAKEAVSPAHIARGIMEPMEQHLPQFT
jgi:hypothetical protein